MKRLTRKDLKTDTFAKDIGQTVDFISHHRSQTLRYGAIGLGVLIVVGGIYIYMRHQATVREAALAYCMRLTNAVVSPTPQPPNLNFATKEELDRVWNKSFTDLATNFHGTQEGAIAQIFLASKQSEKGNLAEAEKMFKDVIDSAPKEYAGWARVSLAQVLYGENKVTEARATMDYLIAHPTQTMSKEQATLELAELIAKDNPAEARKLAEPLRNARTAISRVAIDLIGRLPQTN